MALKILPRTPNQSQLEIQNQSLSLLETMPGPITRGERPLSRVLRRRVKRARQSQR